ncbi:putative lipase 2 [Dioszegia hungarica]|uniref:Lipase 2 n=1 Tax=Dioszegia hungarica TaxID=4972 RepID=A0AA38LWS6_9TREE|nr:putative lipase 2 [Dioszegia hungarica]KAI9639042.1 putative lipase 2 [Dioszegia hungarica]
MPMALGPYRYFQVAQYLVKSWAEQVPRTAAAWKGKGRAEPLIRAPLVRTRREDGLLRAAVQDGTPAKVTEGGNAVAGPSKHKGSYEEPESSPSPKPEPGPPSPRQPLKPDADLPKQPSQIYALMNDGRLLQPKTLKPPREVVVLCHGLYGFSTATPIPLFPSLKLHYWASVLEVLRDQMGVKVLVVGVKGTGSVKERAEQMDKFLKDQLPRGTGVNFVAHSMGGLDCRYLISNIKPTAYTPVSLTTIGTPHHGSPFMDWCAANIGVGSPSATEVAMKGAEAVAKALPYSLKAPLLGRAPGSSKKDTSKGFTTSLTSYLLNIFDSPAYANLTTSFARDHFNPANPDSPDVKYMSVAGRVSKLSVLHPLWFPKLVLDAAAENGYGEDSPGGIKGYLGNDGLVSVHSAQWGEFLGVVDETHHWELRGEGGLFPNTSSLKDADNEEESSANKEDREGWLGWDWQGDFGNGVSEHLDSAKNIAKSTVSTAATAVAKVTPDAVTKATSSATSWDLAQVGQVLDWVTDLVPGGDNVETKKKQLADAKREKERDDERREKEKERAKKKREKFELKRFYGGLMLKLRDEGF